MPKEADVLEAAHAVIKKVSTDIERMSFNTAIAALMEYTNQLYKIEAKDGFLAHEAWGFAIKAVAQLLAPVAPHISEELWHELGNKTSIHQSSWPPHDEAYLVKSSVKIAVQVNGKLRGEIEMPIDSDQAAVEEAAKQHENVAMYLKVDIKRVVFIKDKLVNLVV